MNTNELLNSVMTAAEVVEEYGFSDATVRAAINRGQIEARKAGRVWLLARADVVAHWGDAEPRRRLEIVFPIDMLWQEADADDYNADATEQAYDDAVMRALYRAGYEADITYSTVSSMEITDGNEEPVTDDRYEEIRTIIDGVPVDYIEMDDDNE